MIKHIALLCSIFCLAGCAGVYRVTSTPSGATAYVNQTRWLGNTPCEARADSVRWAPIHVAWSDGVASPSQMYEGTNLFWNRSKAFHFEKPSPEPRPTKAALTTTVPRPSLSVTPVTSRQEFEWVGPAVPHVSASDIGVRWAVVIGISTYHDTRIPRLRYASADARSFHDWLVSPHGGGYAPSRTKLLLDQKATGKEIKGALFVWLKQAIAEDIVVIYFAGHGSPDSPDSPENIHLLPYDADYGTIETTGFPMWDIETALKRYIKAKRVIVIADACHSGGVGQPFDIARRAGRGLKVIPVSSGLEKLSNVQEGVCVVAASGDKQFSQEGKQWGGGHGVFTYFLLKGLKGDADYSKDTCVTLGELTSYLSQEVRRATKNAQSPTVAGRYDPALTIGR